ncbi:universal stress protein [Trinickia soli]|uniref:Universal stress protein UspA n=1 Tax=Trinickia soli TaxID=380675 RepID=A0A2N7WEC5_9BURK|nr:universal stress protein [Trinickia soli]KAA0086249.1 universal stress protein [Paraburkholderia sp. T12-10]PMS27695.1 universal stress protein UspA [Trinickia soli]CAB3659027.1 TRAP-T-associated universal stress protein TeaD [Trinickia soli]
MYQRILVPIDGSPTAQRALDYALALARETHAELIPLYVVDIPIVAYEAPGYDPSIVRDALLETGEALKKDALAAMQRENVRGEPRVVEILAPGIDVAERILEEARATHCDLVVMGTHGRRGFRRLVLGSVAERFTRISCCPVLLIPGAVDDGATATAVTHTASTHRTGKVLL